jgi:hypothetical protein
VRVFSDGHTEDAHAFGERNVAGHVFERVHREVRFAPHHHGFHFAHEEPFAANLREGTILNAIALGSNVDFLQCETREVAT